MKAEIMARYGLATDAEYKVWINENANRMLGMEDDTIVGKAFVALAMAFLLTFGFVASAWAAPDVEYLGKRESITLTNDGACDLDVEFSGPRLVVVSCIPSEGPPRAQQPGYGLAPGETIRIEAGTSEPNPCERKHCRLKLKTNKDHLVVVKAAPFR